MAQTQNLKHKGNIVEHTVRRSNMSITALARELQVSRRSIYNWFNHENLNVEIIDKIGKALQYDFSSEFPEISQFNFYRENQEQSEAEIPDNTDSAFYWKEKYIALLEAHNKHLLANTNSQRFTYNSVQTSGFA